MAPLVRLYRLELGLSGTEVSDMLGIDRDLYLEKEIGSASFDRDELVEIWNWFIRLAESLPENVQAFLKHVHKHSLLQ